MPFPSLSEWQATFAHVCNFCFDIGCRGGGWEHSEEAYGVCVCVSEWLTGDDLEMLSMSGGWMAAILVIPGIFVWAGGRS